MKQESLSTQVLLSVSVLCFLLRLLLFIIIVRAIIITVAIAAVTWLQSSLIELLKLLLSHALRGVSEWIILQSVTVILIMLIIITLITRLCALHFHLEAVVEGCTSFATHILEATGCILAQTKWSLQSWPTFWGHLMFDNAIFSFLSSLICYFGVA